MKSSKKFFWEILLYIPVKLFPAIGTFTILLYLAKNLSGEEYVKYSTGVAISAISIQLASGWLVSSIVYFVPISHNRKKFITDIIVLCFIFGLIAGCIGAIAAGLVIKDINTILIILLICVIQSFYNTFNAILQAERDVTSQILSSSLFSLTLVILGISAVQLLEANHKIALLSLSFSYLAGTLIISKSYIEILHDNSKFISLGANDKTMLSIIRYGSPLSIWATCMLLINSGEKLFPTNDDSFTTYVVIKDLLVGLSSLISMPLIMAAHPLIFRTHREGKDVNKLIATCCNLVSIGFGLTWCLLYYIGFNLIERLTGKITQPVHNEIFIAFLALYLTALSIYIQKPLEIAKRTKLIALIAIITVTLSLPAFYVIVPIYGSKGAAIVFLMSLIVYFILLISKSRLALNIIINPLLIFVFILFAGHGTHMIIENLLSTASDNIKIFTWMVLYISISSIAAHEVFKRMKAM